MTWLDLVSKNLMRRPVRTALTAAGVAIGVEEDEHEEKRLHHGAQDELGELAPFFDEELHIALVGNEIEDVLTGHPI
ncbi:MAG: hypothetical protein ACXVR9_06690, partial [Gaiellaceae bacterium]